MTKYSDATGQRFNRLIAVEKGRNDHWLFQCDCGTSKTMRLSPVRRGVVKSCGCLHRERCRAGINQTKHGDAKVGAVTRLHSIWRGMLKRAGGGYHSADTRYRDRGITVCEEWSEYPAFREWALANGYADNLSLDRIDNDGNYEPGNCRWANRKMQARNRRSSRLLTVGGRSRTIAEWCEIMNLKAPTVSTRLSRGWSHERAIMTPASYPA